MMNGNFSNKTAESDLLADARDWLITSIVIDVLVIVANVVELKVLIGKWKKLDRIGHLLFSLCISDLFSGISMFAQDTQTLKQLLDTGEYAPGSLVSVVLDSLFVFSVLVSVFHVVAIAIERLVAVILPVKYAVFTTFGCKFFTIVFIWVSSIILAPSFSIMQVYAVDQNNTVDESAGRYIRASIFVICCITVFFVYMFLVYALIRREIQMRDMIPKEIRKHTRDRRTTMVCLLLGFSFVVCVLPYTLGDFHASFYHPINNLLITMNHLINPLIYFFKIAMETRRRRSGSSGSILLSHSNGSNQSNSR